jgi:hypothetical protein
MRTLVFAAIAAALTPVAGTADVTRMGFVVNPIDATSFEVPWRGRSGPRTFWCAAGDYVRYDLNMPGNTRIYRTTPPRRGAGEAVRFSLRPEGAGPTGLALIGGGNSISASHALLQCNRR